MRLSQKQQIFSKNVALLIAEADRLGIGVTFGDAHRSPDQQYLYFNGLTFKKGKLVPTRRRSWTYNSMHLKRLAIDLNHFINNGKDLTWKKEDLQVLGDYWESLHPKNRWGGNFSRGRQDVPHYEMQG